MIEPRLRRSVRALLVTPDELVLLAHHRTESGNVWAAPGGGVEDGENLWAALRRELREEVRLELPVTAAPHVWHQEILDGSISAEFDGVSNDYFLVRTPWFAPVGLLGGSAIRDEGIEAFRWWLPSAVGTAVDQVFSPRNLSGLLPETLRSSTPPAPLQLGI